MLDYNATKAAIRAGYSVRSAKQIANEILTKHDVTERIAEYQKEKNEAFQLNAQEVLNRLSRIAERDLAKDSDKIRALELLGKHFQLFTDTLVIQEPSAKGAVIELPAKDAVA